MYLNYINYIFKKVVLTTFKEILQKYVCNSSVMFFNILLFCLKVYSETLSQTDPIKLNRSYQTKLITVSSTDVIN